jgi:hypothetical protein
VKKEKKKKRNYREDAGMVRYYVICYKDIRCKLCNSKKI